MVHSKTKLWSIDYIYTLTIGLIVNIPNIILMTILPLFVLSIGGTNSIAGLLTTVLTMSALIFRPFFGKILDNVGRRMVLVLGLCLLAVSTIMHVLSTNIILLLVLRFFQGIGLSAYSTALGTILSDVVPAPRISEGIGYFGVSQTISLAAGPTLGLYLCDKFGYQTTYVIAFGITLISIAFAYLIRYERKINSIDNNQDKRSTSRNTDVTPQNRLRKGFIEKSSIRPCIVMFFTSFAVSSVFLFMPIFAAARNIEHIGLFFTVYAVSMILSRLFTGKVADRYGYSIVFLPSIAMTLVLFIILAFAYSLPAVLLAAVFYGIGFGTVQPIMNAMVVKLSPPERRGAANATYYATMDISFGTGAFVWGLVSQFAGFTAVFLGCAVCVILSVLAYYLFLHRLFAENDKRSSKEEPD